MTLASIHPATAARSLICVGRSSLILNVSKFRRKVLPLQVIDNRVRLYAQSHRRPLPLSSGYVDGDDDLPPGKLAQHRLQRFDHLWSQHVKSVNLDLMSSLSVTIAHKQIVRSAKGVFCSERPQRF
jgi:hypothetical protein